MKRFFNFFLLTVLLFMFNGVSAFSANDSISVTWSTTQPWHVTWTPIDGVTSYTFYTFKNGKPIYSTTTYISENQSYKQSFTNKVKSDQVVYTEGTYVIGVSGDNAPDKIYLSNEFSFSPENSVKGELQWAKFPEYSGGDMVFGLADGITDYRICLYKDGRLVEEDVIFADIYSIEDGEYSYENSTLWLMDNGTGEYYFTVNTITNGRNNNDTITSNTYYYTRTVRTEKPTNIKVEDGKLKWGGSTGICDVVYYVTYDNRNYIPFYTVASGRNQQSPLGEYVFKEYYAFITAKALGNSRLYPKSKAKMVAAIISEPEIWGDGGGHAKSAYYYFDGTRFSNVKGIVKYNGAEVEHAQIYLNGKFIDSTNIDGGFNFTYDKGKYTFVVQYAGMSEVFTVDFSQPATDLGTINLTSKSKSVQIRSSAVSQISGISGVFAESHNSYAEKDGNIITADVAIEDTQASDAMQSVMDSYCGYYGHSAFDISINLIKTGEENTTSEVTETNALLSVAISSENLNAGSDYVVLREHDGGVDALTTVPNADGEYIELSNDELIIWAKKFSTYAVLEKSIVSGVTASNNGYSIGVELNDNLIASGDSAIMIVCLYQGEKMTGREMLSVDSTFNSTVNVECEEADNYKIFIWADTQTLAPECKEIKGTI